MSVQHHEPGYWSDVFQTEIRLPQTCDSKHCIMPPDSMGRRASRIAIARMAVKAFLERVYAGFVRRSRTPSVVSSPDLSDAYMHACLATPFFCYVSPELYRLTTSMGDRGATQVDAHAVDDL